MATVRDVMTTEVVTVHPDLGIAEVADLLAARGIGAVPVIDDAGAFVGLLRDEDLLLREAGIHLPTTIAILPGIEFTLPSHLRRYDEDLRAAAASQVADLMEREPATIGPDASLEDLATLMHSSEVTHVPVVDADGHVAGIVARGDIIRHIARTT
mgnify:FL=1